MGVGEALDVADGLEAAVALGLLALELGGTDAVDVFEPQAARTTIAKGRLQRPGRGQPPLDHVVS